ncbi:hypothetical protein, partial [Caballeronia sp. INML5]|uniref:hypothetical protein n=1 Tax=Caballeronia sp. INML5 TaxID=2921750 RepID=UPI002027E021
GSSGSNNNGSNGMAGMDISSVGDILGGVDSSSGSNYGSQSLKSPSVSGMAADIDQSEPEDIEESLEDPTDDTNDEDDSDD